VTHVLASSAVCFPDGAREGWVAIEDETIVECGDGPAPGGSLDLGARPLAPGLVDLQCNGLGSIDFATAEPAQWHEAQRALARHGVTSFCPTFVTAPLEAYAGMLDAAALARATTSPGEGTAIGVHLEGPFLGGAPGAHDPALVRAAETDWLRELLGAHPGLVRLVTLAPEADPDGAATRWLVSSGVVVALGHTTASYDDARDAADAGASVVTHLYNGMAPWHHRSPGVVGAALDDERLTPTLIADLVHVHPANVRLTFAATRVAVVSDSVATNALASDREGAARLEDGTLAGATTLLDSALRNLVSIGISLPRAIEAVASVPAALLGCDDRGAIERGRRADLVALDPRSLAVERVWIAGVEPPVA
jgi:N-acetylglucosamine-6-phosphate deacetylase